MGRGQSSSGSSGTQETALSREQAKILEAREGQYQRFFFPEIVSDLQGTGGDGRTSDIARSAVGDVNRSYRNTSGNFRTQLAQRGLAGSGVESQGLAMLEASRGSALADAFQQARAQNRANRTQLFQIGGGLSPQPTTAAPLSQSSKQRSSGFGFLGS